jgi:hypothetical protein
LVPGGHRGRPMGAQHGLPSINRTCPGPPPRAHSTLAGHAPANRASLSSVRAASAAATAASRRITKRSARGSPRALTPSRHTAGPTSRRMCRFTRES